MIGNFDLPIAENKAKTYIFTPTPGALQLTSIFRSMQMWNKPKGINFVYGLLIGAGSGGGGGFSFGAGTAGGGGGGGTPGAIVQFLQPAYLVPDTLYVTVARGGLGGAAGSNGGFPNVTGLFYGNMGNQAAASRTYYVYPNNAQSALQSGRNGTNVAGGNGGTVLVVISTQAIPGIVGFSNFVQPTPLAGFNGGFASAGTNATYVGRVAGGAGGGGVSAGVAYTGGNVIAPSTSANSIWNQNLSGGANTGVSGSNGITLFNPTFFSLPGAGGGATLSGTGGRGGDGGVGCGGGGGGAGPTGGAGGNGGDGFIMLVCW
jgi:hypothetical protein